MILMSILFPCFGQLRTIQKDNLLLKMRKSIYRVSRAINNRLNDFIHPSKCLTCPPRVALLALPSCPICP